MDQFEYHNWRPLCGEVKEDIPPDAPETQGKEVELRCYVDANYAGDLKTCRSQTGFLILLNKAPNDWY